MLIFFLNLYNWPNVKCPNDAYGYDSICLFEYDYAHWIHAITSNVFKHLPLVKI